MAAGLLLALALVAGQAVVHRHHFVDDAAIGFRYAKNLAHGHGFVWTTGDPPVEGVTNLGWVLLLAPFGDSPRLPEVAKLLGTLALATTLVLATALHGRLAPRAGALERAALPLLLATQPELVYFSLAGMETAVVALASLGLVALCLHWEDHPRATAAGLGVAATALFVLRPETALVPLAFAAWRGLRGDRRGLGTLALATGLGLGAVTLWRLATFGAALPNTFVAKAPGSPQEIAGRALAALGGGLDNLPAPFFGLGLAVAFWGARSLRRTPGAARDVTVTLVATGVTFAIYARPDWTGLGRYFAPFVPGATMLLLRGGAELAARVAPARSRALLAAGVLWLVGLGTGRHLEHLMGPALETYPGFVVTSETLVGPARQMAAEIPPGATVACRRLGVLGFATAARVFDYAFGLTDPEVANLLRHTGRSDFDNARAAELGETWRRVRPDYLVEDWTRLASWLVPGEDARHFRIHGVPYEVIATYPIAQGGELWTLARRRFDEPVAAADDWRAAAERRGPRDPLHP